MPRPEPAKRAEALELVPRIGINATARQLGLNKGTVSRWWKATGLPTVSDERTRAVAEATRLHWQEYRIEMVHDLGATAKKALEAINVAIDEGKARNASDLARVLCATIDKAQLLSGAETNRTAIAGVREEVLADARRRGLSLVS